MPTVPVSETLAKADNGEQSLRAALGVRSAKQARGRSRTGWCTVEGCRIAWEQVSHSGYFGYPVVCLHGVGSGSREFRPLLERVPAGARLICFDWPGHGRSEDLKGKPAIAGSGLTIECGMAIVPQVLRELKIERPILLGSGFGAAVAIRMAAEDPESVSGLILSQPAGLVPPATADPFSFGGRRAGDRATGRLLARAQQNAPSSAVAGRSGAATRQQILRLTAVREAMRPARAVARQSLERSAAALRAALASLTCPALFAFSRQNLEYPVRRYLALLDPSLAWAPQHQFTVFAGAFHPLWDEPMRFAQAVTAFVQAQLPFASHTHAWIVSAVDYPARNMNTWKCVHPDCGEEKVVAVGRNPNEPPAR